MLQFDLLTFFSINIVIYIIYETNESEVIFCILALALCCKSVNGPKNFKFQVQLTQVESDVKILQVSFQILKEHRKKSRNLGSKIVRLLQGKGPNFVKKMAIKCST